MDLQAFLLKLVNLGHEVRDRPIEVITPDGEALTISNVDFDPDNKRILVELKAKD